VELKAFTSRSMRPKPIRRAPPEPSGGDPDAGPRRPLRLLYVEEDATAASYVTRGLAWKGFVVDHAADALTGFEAALGGSYDLIISEVALPDRDGFQLLRDIRAARIGTPVLFLSARRDVGDRIRGLELGADDYLAKPFALAELVARIRAVARRTSSAPNEDEPLRIADLVLDTGRWIVERRGRPIRLTRKQFALLEYLLRNAGRTLSRDRILAEVWGYGFEARSNVLDVHVAGLRARIDRDFEPKLLHTVRGLGYVLEARAGRIGRASGGKREAP
jgi:two-component system, OmpR family, copper resistance phosphate regulon response regulator CusR